MDVPKVSQVSPISPVAKRTRAKLGSEWFGNIYMLLSYQSKSNPPATLLRKAFRYRKHGDILWIYRSKTDISGK